MLDISLRNMTGFEVADRLRHSGSTTALVFLPLYAEEDIVARARTVGAIGYVVQLRLVADLTHAVGEAHMGDVDSFRRYTDHGGDILALLRFGAQMAETDVWRPLGNANGRM